MQPAIPLSVVIHTLDSGPDDLEAQLPIRARLLRKLPGSDNGDYTLAELATPISWKKNGLVRKIRYIVVGPHLLGTFIKRGEKSLALKIAYVTDDRQADRRNSRFRTHR